MGIKKDRIDAVSTIVSAILAISIVIVAALSTIFWGIPYVNDLRSQESLENAKMQFNLIIDNIKDIITGEGDSKNELSIAIEEGSLSINKNEFDRTILMYSYNGNSKYNFSISGLGDNDRWFDIFMSNYSNINVKGWFFNDSSNYDYYYEENFFISLVGKVTASTDFKGKVCILLYDGQMIPENLFGKIWLFDSESLVFKTRSNTGLHKLTLEKGGIIYNKNGNSKVEKLFNVFLKDDTFGLHVLQTLSSESFSVSGGSGFNLKINIDSIGSSIQEITDVYNLRLQLYGDNAQPWIKYINNKYFNKFVISDEDIDGSIDTLFLSESSNGVKLTFINSIVGLNKV